LPARIPGYYRLPSAISDAKLVSDKCTLLAQDSQEQILTLDFYLMVIYYSYTGKL
jgi:hypothetical protein